MNHDELLERIRFGNNLGNVQFTWEQTVALQPLIDIREALRAAVELHKPSLGGACSHCSTTTFWTAYPCPTIQAIEKELQ